MIFFSVRSLDFDSILILLDISAAFGTCENDGSASENSLESENGSNNGGTIGTGGLQYGGKWMSLSGSSSRGSSSGVEMSWVSWGLERFNPSTVKNMSIFPGVHGAPMKMQEGPCGVCVAGVSDRWVGTGGAGGVACASEPSGGLNTNIIIGTTGSHLHLALPSIHGIFGACLARFAQCLT